MGIIIKPLFKSPFSYDEVVNLLHESFKERLDQGLDFTCSTMSVESFKRRTKDSTVLVAWDKDTNQLLGTITVTLKADSKGYVYGYSENLAIISSAKRLGIGTKLLEELIIIVVNAGGRYILSDTAVEAESSVRWHLKNGFKIIALRSFSSTNYYSYIFRRQLAPSKVWNSKFYSFMRYSLSSFIIKKLYKVDGNYTRLGQLVFGFFRST